MTNQELIKEINNNNFNVFELKNNLTDEVVKGNIIKLYGSTKGGMRIADELTLEYDRIYGIYLPNYAHKLACKINPRPVSRCEDIQFNPRTGEYELTFGQLVLFLKCKYNPRKIIYSKAENLEPIFDLGNPDMPQFTDLLHEECIDVLRSQTLGNITTLVLDCYTLGKFDGEDYENWSNIYLKLLNGRNKIGGDNYRIYGKGSTPYVQYDYNTDKCYLGLWSFSEEKNISQFEPNTFRNKSASINLSDDFEDKVKKLCDTYRYYNSMNGSNIKFAIGNLEVKCKIN